MSVDSIVDAIFKALIAGDREALDKIQYNRAAECLDVRALISTSESGGVPLELELGVASSIFVTPFFEGPRAFFLSKETSVQALINDGRSHVLLDYSLSFDSNVAEKIRAFINGEKIGEADHARVVEVLMLRARNSKVQFDIIPFLYENIRHSRENAKNKRPLNTIVAFRMLDHLNWEVFEENKRLEYDRPVESLKASIFQKAEADLQGLFDNPSLIRHEAKVLVTQAILLRLANLWHSKKFDSKRILNELIDYCYFCLGFYPKTELGIIWSGISKKEVAPFFGPINGRSKQMIDEIRGMSWDLQHLRLLEEIAQKSDLGSFFIPFFVSFDDRWRNLMRLSPARLMIGHTSGVNFLYTEDMNLFEACAECASPSIEAEQTPDKIEARRKMALNIDREKVARLVEAEINACKAWL